MLMEKPDEISAAESLHRVGINLPELKQMSMKELSDLRHVLHTVADILTAFTCQPRFEESEATLNKAGGVIEQITEFVSFYEAAVIDVVAAARPAELKEVTERSWALLGYHADAKDGLTAFTALAAEAVHDEEKARLEEVRSRAKE